MFSNYCCVPNEINVLRNQTIYHRYLVSQENNEMVDFILRKWTYLEKEFRTYRDGFKNWKDKMRTHSKIRGEPRIGWIFQR